MDDVVLKIAAVRYIRLHTGAGMRDCEKVLDEAIATLKNKCTYSQILTNEKI